MTAPADNTPASIIADAYFDAGLLQEGSSPNGEQLVRGSRILKDLINLWQVQDGLRLWLNYDLSVTLTAGTGLYTFGPAGTVVMTKPLRVMEAYWLSADGIRRPLTSLSWDDYIRLSQVDTSGTINSYFVNKQATTLNVFFWMPPDATDALGTGHLLIQQQVENFTGLTDTMNFPIEWRMALRWGLADDICTGQPQSIMERCQQRAQMYYTVLSAWDVEDSSTYFTVDTHSMRGSKFR